MLDLPKLFEHKADKILPKILEILDCQFANGVKNLLHCEVEVAKRNELHTFKVIPKRWVVERSFSWLEKCRRLWKNCEKKLNTSLHMVVLAFIVLFVKRF